MGQRTASARGRSAGPSRSRQPSEPLQLAVFATDLGWMGLLGSGARVARLFFCHSTAGKVRQAAEEALSKRAEEEGTGSPGELAEADWSPELRRRLERYARGDEVDFAEFEVEFPAKTTFQRRVFEATRRIPYGKTLTYAELAAKAGSPGAARAVGNVMKSNCVPLIVPCHRVVGAGTLGGYSAPQGLELKKRLLQMESETVAGE